MSIEERIFTENELSYEQLNQMKEHAKKYDYEVDKKEFLRRITPYEQKLVLLETKNPYEVLTYLDELNFENTRLILNDLTSTEIRKVIDEFSSEDKKNFYANFSDLSLVNQFIKYDVNSKDHITDLKTERKVEILNSSNEQTKESATKVYETIKEEEKDFVMDSINTLDAKLTIDQVVLENQVEQQLDEEQFFEEQEQLNEESEEQQEELEEEQKEEELEEEQKEEELEEKQEEKPVEQLNEINNFMRDRISFYIKNIPQFSNINLEEENLYTNLSPELKQIIDNDFNLYVKEKNKENLELFQEAKSTCEHEVINSVLSNSKREETVELEMDNEKTL